MPKPALLLLLFTISLFAIACETNSATDPLRPKIDMNETQAPMLASTGPFDIQYQLDITNPSQEPITLKKLQLTTTGDGYYSLRRDPYFFTQTIPPGTTGSVVFYAHAYANYYPGTSQSTMPVSIRGVAIFDAPNGSFQQVFTKLIPQFAE
jgi:hypothetical protein